MEIELRHISVRDLTSGYRDDAESGVVGYGGALDIRPAYQREFIYKDHQRGAVIETVLSGFPLNVMYWAADEERAHFEVIDGQQRTISICQYVNGDFSHDGRYFGNLPSDVRERILAYVLTVYWCTGSESEKLAWFETINIAGERLTAQELRNAVYSGPWVTDAKRYFAKTGCVAYSIGSKFINGSPIRQDYLETALRWISGGNVVEFMARHQHDTSAEPVWDHFSDVIKWVIATFPKYRKEMKGVDWGRLYAECHEAVHDPEEIAAHVERLMMDDDVTHKAGIYPYVLTGQEKYLSIRQFTPAQKRQAYERQSGVCPKCRKEFPIEAMQADHTKPWSKGGRTTQANCKMLCAECNRKKSDA